MTANGIHFFNDASIDLSLTDFDKSFVSILPYLEQKFTASLGWFNVIFMDDQAHTDLNIQYLDHHYSTDVLSFDMSENESICGEIYINVEVATSNAQLYHVGRDMELKRLVCHGLLHLCGMDDHSDEERATMKLNEDELLEKIIA